MADKPTADAVKKYSVASTRSMADGIRRAQATMLNDPTLQNLDIPLAENYITNDIKARVGGNIFSFARDQFAKYST
jgi:hypothetical protein